MCGHSLVYFGASYPDAICIKGYLWDADSDDGEGGLTSGGEVPCPACNTASHLLNRLADLEEEIPQPSDRVMPAEGWEDIVKYCLSVSPNETARTLRTRLPKCAFLDMPGRIASPERLDPDPDLADLVWRDWPWRIPGIAAHEMIALYPQDSAEKGAT